MDVIALVLMIIALVIFLAEALGRRISPNVAFVPLGLAFLTAGLIAQFASLADKVK